MLTFTCPECNVEIKNGDIVVFDHVTHLTHLSCIGDAPALIADMHASVSANMPVSNTASLDDTDFHAPTSHLTVATDGSCYPNPGPGGWAWVDEHGNYERGSFSQGTNNIGELEAIKYVLLAHPNTEITIEYDSEYAMKCVTAWGPSWVKKGIAHEKANHELVLEIMGILDRRIAPVHWRKVKGHDKNNAYPLNTAVDKLANEMCKKKSDYFREKGTCEIVR